MVSSRPYESALRSARVCDPSAQHVSATAALSVILFFTRAAAKSLHRISLGAAGISATIASAPVGQIPATQTITNLRLSEVSTISTAIDFLHCLVASAPIYASLRISLGAAEISATIASTPVGQIPATQTITNLRLSEVSTISTAIDFHHCLVASVCFGHRSTSSRIQPYKPLISYWQHDQQPVYPPGQHDYQQQAVELQYLDQPLSRQPSCWVPLQAPQLSCLEPPANRASQGDPSYDQPLVWHPSCWDPPAHRAPQQQSPAPPSALQPYTTFELPPYVASKAKIM